MTKNAYILLQCFVEGELAGQLIDHRTGEIVELLPIFRRKEEKPLVIKDEKTGNETRLGIKELENYIKMD